MGIIRRLGSGDPLYHSGSELFRVLGQLLFLGVGHKGRYCACHPRDETQEEAEERAPCHRPERVPDILASGYKRAYFGVDDPTDLGFDVQKDIADAEEPHDHRHE